MEQNERVDGTTHRDLEGVGSVAGFVDVLWLDFTSWLSFAFLVSIGKVECDGEGEEEASFSPAQSTMCVSLTVPALSSALLSSASLYHHVTDPLYHFGYDQNVGAYQRRKWWGQSLQYSELIEHFIYLVPLLVNKL